MSEKPVVGIICLRPGHPEEGVIMPGGSLVKCDFCGCDVNMNPLGLAAAKRSAHLVDGELKVLCRPCAKREVPQGTTVMPRSLEEREQLERYFGKNPV